jgi:hypothetical protein
MSLAILVFASAAATAQSVSFATTVEFGQIGGSDPVTATVQFANELDVTVDLSFAASCPCVWIDPTTMTIPAGEQRTGMISPIPEGLSGPAVRAIRVRSSDPRIASDTIVVRAEIGTVTTSTPCPTCRQTDRLASPAEQEERTGSRFLIVEHDIIDPDEMDELLSVLSSRGVELTEFPVAISESGVFQGLASIGIGLRATERPGPDKETNQQSGSS